MNIPATGPNPPKTKFFRDVATAFEFLALFHSLQKEEQESLMEYLTKLQAKERK